MKKIKDWLLYILGAVFLFFTGYIARQPQINKLKKNVKMLQKDNEALLALIDSKQKEFRELLVQYKAIKALQHLKKASSKGKLKENLIFQYAIREYLELLLKRVKYEEELTKQEIKFFNSFEKALDGKPLKPTDFTIVKGYILDRYSKNIQHLVECDYTSVFQALTLTKNEPTIAPKTPPIV